MPEKRRYCRSTFYHEGKRYECTGKTQKEADQKAAVKRNQLERGEIGVSGNMTVARWGNEWLETYKQLSVGGATFRNYFFYVNKVISPEIGEMLIKNVKNLHLQKIINDRKGKSKSDITKLRIVIKAIFKKANGTGVIPTNPAEHLEIPVAKSGTYRNITDDERKAMLKVAESHRAGLWIKVLLYCGLRPGETRALKWEHINFEKRIIHVKSAMKSSTRVISAPKSASGVRDIPIPNTLIHLISEAKGEPWDPVFARETKGLHHTETSMRAMWKSFKRELDILMGAELYRNKITKSIVAEDLCPYCLRHTYCTDLQDAGVPINVARYLMGHSDISMTAKIYTHTTETTIQDAADKINLFIN